MTDQSTSAARMTISDEHKAHALRVVNGRSRFRVVWEWMKSFIVAVFLFMVVRTFLIEAFKIPTGSMERTLLVGDFLLVNKAVYGAEVPFTHERLPAIRRPTRGDVIVFDFPRNPGQNFVKRLIGVAGDTLESRDGNIMLNGHSLAEPYVVHSDPSDPASEDFHWQRDFLVRSAQASVGYHPSRNNWGPIVVPQRSYFVLGDNRDNSYDSRYWGFVPDSLVKGEPLVVYYSYERDNTHRFTSWFTHVRWDRIGERIR